MARKKRSKKGKGGGGGGGGDSVGGVSPPVAAAAESPDQDPDPPEQSNSERGIEGESERPTEVEASDSFSSAREEETPQASRDAIDVDTEAAGGGVDLLAEDGASPASLAAEHQHWQQGDAGDAEEMHAASNGGDDDLSSRQETQGAYDADTDSLPHRTHTHHHHTALETPGGAAPPGEEYHHAPLDTPGAQSAMTDDSQFHESVAGGGGGIFFADATLDLEEAHGIAETPTPGATGRKLVLTEVSLDAVPGLPLAHRGLPQEHFGDHSAEIGGAGEGLGQISGAIDRGALMSASSSVSELGDGSLTQQAQLQQQPQQHNIEGEGGGSKLATASATSMLGGRAMNRITGGAGSDSLNGGTGAGGLGQGGVQGSVITSSMPSVQPTYRPRPPRRPRDVPWAAGALLFVPLCLWLPLTSRPPHPPAIDDDDPAAAAHFADLVGNSWRRAAYSPQGHTSTLLSLLLAYGAAVALTRILYRTPGGGDGEDARHFAADVVVGYCRPLAFAVVPVSAILIWVECPNAWGFALIPAGMFVKDLVVLRAGAGAPDVPTSIGGGSRGMMTMGMSGHDAALGGSGSNRRGMGAGSTDDGRQTFFRALLCTALDILSRSLRRQAVHRAVLAAISLQLLVVMLWRTALLRSLASSHSLWGKLMVLAALFGGKWATGIVTRILSLVASGGVTSWFAQQSIMIDEMERAKEGKRAEEERKAEEREMALHPPTAEDGGGTPVSNASNGEAGGGSASGATSKSGHDSASEDYNVGYNNTASQFAARSGGSAANSTSGGVSSADAAGGSDAVARAAYHSLPEAYRTADADIYSPVVDFDEGMDDDFSDDDELDGDEEEEGAFIGNSLSSGGRKSKRSRRDRNGKRPMDGLGGGGYGRRPSSEWTGGGSGGRSTVKSFLVSACTVSFGSVAQCGLVGGFAQVLWGFVRNVDALAAAANRRLSSARGGRGNGANGGFRGMDIGEAGYGGRRGPADWWRAIMTVWSRFDVAARDYVRSHSDLAMSHVAAYFKGYQRAANDVAALIDASGVEPIIHDDITTHMCSCVCTAVAGIVTVFVGYIVAHHRSGSSKVSPLPPLSDAAVVEMMLLAFAFCYVLVFTVMEPLRSAIKAVYVCFAQHPRSLSQAFPLIFHRLTRISETNANLVV